MTIELVHGQNHPLPGTSLEVRVSAGTPVVAGVSLGDGQGRVSGPGSVAHPGAPRLPGIEVPARLAAEQRVTADLAAVPADVDRVHVLLALPPLAGAPTRFGACPAPHLTVAGPDGIPVVSFTATGLGAEAAIVVLELYRRQGAWKVRALGQGYAGGLAELLRDQGLGRSDADAVAARVADAVRPAPALPSTPSAPPPPASPPPPPPASPSPPPADSVPHMATPASAPVAGDAAGWSMEERLYNQVWGMFEDLARTIAAYRSAVDFAESRLDQELDTLLADPRTRVGPAAEAARDQARARQAELVDRARAVLDRDLAQLTAEAEVVEPALPAPYAGWESPVWHGYRVPAEPPMAVRLGDLHLPERPELRVPLLVRLPLERGLWVDSAQDRRRAVDVAVALAARLLASHPAGECAVHVIDPAGSAVTALTPFTDSGALREPPATGAAGVAALLARLTERVDLVQMALRAGVPFEVPPGVDPARQVLVVNDFPYGFDDRTINQLRYLADEGPQVGVHLVVVADRDDAREYGPLLDPLWRSLMRLTPQPDDHLADPWVGHSWTYEPLLAPAGSAVLSQVLRQVAAARRTYDPGRH
ncbi:TerD family protein [Actinacidiphila sp. bgisy160]|uniref:TerD family protein n=1 Tax=Actinacidiphila sp. bgisy160 TaxID=3413796 RepID=UPI003D739E8A